MQRRILSVTIISALLFSFFNWSCSKLDTTDIGSDLLPAVDNVHTFADTLAINTTQGLFDDSTVVSRTYDHALGAINNDPLFGKTNANIYFQLKPSFFPFYWGNSKDTIAGIGLGLDSVVLCLNYKSFWGDSTIPVDLKVYEVNDINFDTSYYEHNIKYKPIIGTFLTSSSVDIRRLTDTIKYRNGRDYSVNQIRITMPAAWSNQLFNRDSIQAGAGNNAFYSDSVFRSLYRGLAVVAEGGGNALMYVNLADTSTKLEVHFRRRNHGIIDTTYSSLYLNSQFSPAGTINPSATANYIKRDRAGYPVSSPTANELYLQTSPGTYVNLSIPGLSALNNRVIHRAEIQIQQIPTSPLDDILSAPAFLYIDLRDTTLADQWKPIYYDLNPSYSYNPDSQTGYGYLPPNIDFLNYGGYRRAGVDKFGNPIKYYNFNVSRYVQRLVTNHTSNYVLRLYAPYSIVYLQYANAAYPATPSLYGNNIAAGRVKIGIGSNPNYKMIMRIIYSKL